MLLYLASFLASVALSFVLTWYVRNIAIARKWVAGPNSPRHLHSTPIPRVGGVSIYLSFVVSVGAIATTSLWMKRAVPFSEQRVLYILIAGTLVFLLGLYDDIRSVTPRAKIAIQIVAGVLLFWNGSRALEIGVLLGSSTLAWATELLLTVFWVLLITNAFNLIDGLDGLAAGSALFSTLTVFVVSLVDDNSGVSFLSILLAGVIIGFLRFNFNPATIFLGDCGSLFVGFMLSALALEGVQQKSSTIVAVAIPIVSFGLPVLEASISIVRRFISGQPFFAADRDHIHHRLLEMGFSHRGAVVILYGVSALCGLLSLFLLHPGGKYVGIVLVVLGTGIWLGVQHLGYHEFFELKRAAQRTFKQRQIIVNNLAIRRAAERLWKVEEYSQLYRVLEGTFSQNGFDGFELCLGPTFVANTESRGQVTNLRHIYKKGTEEDKAVGALGFDWTLTLSLVSSRRQKVGFFSLYKMSNTALLLIDINLLTTEFASALADAVERCLRGIEKQTTLEGVVNAKVTVGAS